LRSARVRARTLLKGRFELARAAVARAQGQTEAARTHLVTALALSRERGFIAIAREAEKRLSALGPASRIA
jgi:hypothetical protein